MHQHPKQYLKDAAVVDNSWQLVTADTESLPAGDILVPVNYWQANQQQLADHSGNVGVWIDSHEEIEEFAGSIAALPVIAINFPKFVDGTVSLWLAYFASAMAISVKSAP